MVGAEGECEKQKVEVERIRAEKEREERGVRMQIW